MLELPGEIDWNVALYERVSSLEQQLRSLEAALEKRSPQEEGRVLHLLETRLVMFESGIERGFGRLALRFTEQARRNRRAAYVAAGLVLLSGIASAAATLDAIETYRDMVVGLMDLHLSSASHRMNEVMKTLTIVATIFIPMTFVAGVYGMNFDYMPELGWTWSYPTFWAVMVALGLGLLALFRWHGWIGTSASGFG